MKLLKLIKLLLKETASGFKKIITGLNYTALCAVLFALSFVLYFFPVRPFFWSKILDSIYSIAQFISQDSSLLVGISNNPIFQPHIAQIIKYSVLLALTVYLLYAILHGLAWFYASRKILHHRISFWGYFGKFALFSLFYFALMTAAIVFSLNYSFSTLFSHETANTIVLVVVLLVIIYFMLISYGLLLRHSIGQTFRRTFLLGVKKAHYALAMFVPLIILFALLDIILNFAAKLPTKLYLSAGLVLLCLCLVYTAVYISGAVEKVEEKIEKKEKAKKK